MNEEAPNYLINFIPKGQVTRVTRNCNTPRFYCRTDSFKFSFFPFTLHEWFKLDGNIRNSESISIFKSKLLTYIRPIQNTVYNIFDPTGLKFLTRLRLGFSHLNEHKFRHNFQDCINPLCTCSLNIEDTVHYLLHCHHFSQHRPILISSVKSVFDNFEFLSDDAKKDLLLYGDSKLEIDKNKLILVATLTYINSTERFSGSLFE